MSCITQFIGFLLLSWLVGEPLPFHNDGAYALRQPAKGSSTVKQQADKVSASALAGSQAAVDAAEIVEPWHIHYKNQIICGFVILMHLLGGASSVKAIMQTRTSQGSIAWFICLNTCPYLAVPAYWVLGQSKFEGYHSLRSKADGDESIQQKIHQTMADMQLLFKPTTARDYAQATLLRKLARLPITTGNDAKLLINGEDTFDAIINRISQAQSYVLVQFYILRDDALGQRLKAALIERAQAGIRISLLFDELGSKDLSDRYIEELRSAGVKISPFNTRKGRGHRFRVNFRNHRKIVVVDGQYGYVGGHNVGVEYLGQDPILTPWRDTHVEVSGPVVLCLQVSFVEDWLWATGNRLDLNWKPQKAAEADKVAMCIPTGPADQLETGTLMFLDMINSARKRIWIVSPYFVPDDEMISALQLAALREVDVRILVPENPDHQLVYLSSFSYLQEAENANVRIFRYKPGFLHQKVMLIDDDMATVGTANFDNRSMRLNFEVTIAIHDVDFASRVEEMLIHDFAQSRLVSASEYTSRSFCFRLAVRGARLLAPIQ
ncbi:MAG: cardiolipin synthase [Planctomycetaceae bacterium]|nr:cardiolipin synthase [Planctomycetaceae bacterium]